MVDTENREIVLKGIGASPGICTGKAYLVNDEGVNVVKKYRISEENLSGEMNRFKTAVKKSERRLKEVIENTPEDLRQHANILETAYGSSER